MRTKIYRRWLPGILAISMAAGMNAQEYVLEDHHISDHTGYNFKQPSLSVGPEGMLAYAWEHVGGNGIWMKTYSMAEGVLSEVTQVTAPFYHSHTWIQHSETGRFMLMYAATGSSGWTLFAQLYDPDGNEMGDTINVSGHYEEFINWANASIDINARNEFVVMFPGQDSLMVVWISEEGEFTGESTVLKPDMSSTFGLKGTSCRNRGFIISWMQPGGNVFFRQFSENGEALGASVQVSELEAGHFINDYEVKCDTSGNFILVWEETYEETSALYAQLFDVSGEKVGNRVEILDPEGVYSGNLSLDMDLDGKSVVAWTDGRRGDTTFIYLQQLDDAGEKSGTNYKATLVNDTTASEGIKTTQHGSAVRLLNDTIYLVWQNDNPSAYHTMEIYANALKWKVPEATGLNHLKAGTDVTAFPNPTRGMITLDLGHVSSGTERVRLYNAMGALVMEKLLLPGSAWVEMDLTTEPPGVYYLRVTGSQIPSALPLILLDR